jgi:hypothetical protein
MRGAGSKGAASCYTIDVTEAEPGKPNTLGCAIFAIAILGLVIGAGLWFAKSKDAAMTPCEKYGAIANRVLYNCHSGLDKAPEHHTAVCERALDPTPACLKRLEALTCDELRVPPEVATGEACARK